MLAEHNVRTGFFEADQFTTVKEQAAASPAARRGVRLSDRLARAVGSLAARVAQRRSEGRHRHAGPRHNEERRGRTIYLTAALCTLLEAQVKASEALKAQERDLPVCVPSERQTHQDFDKAWRTACEKAGCPGKLLHDFRRTAVRDYVRAGIPERVAMAMSGHKTRAVFDRYDIVSPGDLQAAAATLDSTRQGQLQGQSRPAAKVKRFPRGP